MTKSETFQPQASVERIKNFFDQYFSAPRISTIKNTNSFIQLKRALLQKFIQSGLQTAFQSFYFRMFMGHNIIGIYPGVYRKNNQKHLDNIIVIGAHFDTIQKSPGVHDNGSGSVAVMELIQLIVENQCQFNSTIIFILFDMEERVIG